MSTRYYIGCSGYYYPYWKNRFYPQGLQPKNWLAYYSTIFNTVELNGTFYRTPKPSDLEKYANVTGDEFRFSVKMSRYLSHTLKLNQCASQVLEFQDMIRNNLKHKLSCFLFQMPASFQYTAENLQRVLDTVPNAPENVVEFRHESWWNPDVQKALSRHHITFCNVDYPGLNSYFMETTSRSYLRLHGNPELFKSSYTKPELEKFFNALPKQQDQYHVYCNNTYYEAGYTNALQLKELANA